MSYGKALTISELIDLIGNQKQCFSNDLIPLSNDEVKAIRRYSAYIAQPCNPEKRNTTKKRIHNLLTDIWTHEPTVFVLCALVAYPTRIPSQDGACLRKVLEWWQGTDHPQGLLAIVESYSHILPGGNEVASRTIAIPKKRHSGVASNSGDDDRRKRVRIEDNASIEVTDGVGNLGHDVDGFQRQKGADDEALPETSDSHELEIPERPIEASTAIRPVGLETGTGSTSLSPGGELQFLAQWPIINSTDILEIYDWQTMDAIKIILPITSKQAAKDAKPAYSDTINDYYYAALKQSGFPRLPHPSLAEKIQRSKQWQEEMEQNIGKPAGDLQRTTCLTIGFNRQITSSCVVLAVVDGRAT